MLESIREYVERATPGPWLHKDGDVYRDDDDGYDELIEYGTFYLPEDGEFCARARSDMPRLLAVAEAAAAYEQVRSGTFWNDGHAYAAAEHRLWAGVRAALAALNDESPSE